MSRRGETLSRSVPGACPAEFVPGRPQSAPVRTPGWEARRWLWGRPQATRSTHACGTAGGSQHQSR